MSMPTHYGMHVRIEMTPPHHTMKCDHCGNHHVLHTPVDLEMALVQMREFGRRHRTCPKPAVKTEAHP